MARIVRRTNAPARKLVWTRSAFNFNLAALGDTGTQDVLAGYRTDGGPTVGCTITRVRLSYNVVPDIGTAGIGSSALMGLIVGHRSDTGISAPLQQSGDDWMMWQFLGATAPGSSAADNEIWSGETDVRAQRKCDEVGQTLWLSAENTSNPSAAFVVGGYISCLLRLP